MGKINFARVLAGWRTPAFAEIAGREIERLGVAALPLQEALRHTSYVSEKGFQASILRVSELSDAICIKAGIFYYGVTAGCSCADDPTPLDECPEYCELEFEIDKATGWSNVRLLTE